MNTVQLVSSVLCLNLDDLEFLYSKMGEQIALKRNDRAYRQMHLEGAASKSETPSNVVEIFDHNPKKRGAKRSPTSARSLVHEYLVKNGQGERKEIIAHCQKINPKLTVKNIDLSSTSLVGDGKAVKMNGIWKLAA